MNRALVCLGIATASCGLITGYLAFPAAATTPAPAPPANVTTLPSPDQVSDAVDASRCPWAMAYAASLTASVTRASSADRNATSAEPAAADAMLLKAPLVAALCRMFGS